MKLLKSTVTVGSATILSRILGFVRDVVLAKMFGGTAHNRRFGFGAPLCLCSSFSHFVTFVKPLIKAKRL